MLLTVVVPVYNVATYLQEAMLSVLDSSPHPLEVIAVDDGSTDASPSILEDLRTRYPETLRVHTTKNAGSGAARNLAVSHAHGEFLTFVDPDDLVVEGAHEALVRQLQRTGSDFAVCHFERLHPDGGRSELAWATRVHARRERAVLDDVPEIVGDVFCWNKVFRRDFWQRHEISFPVGTRYQDQPPITEAFLAATAFDVSPEVGYLWRIRDDRSSVTQNRGDLGNLRDRADTKRQAWASVRERGSAAVQRTFHDRVMPGDLHQFFNAVPSCDDDYWELLRSMVLELWGEEHSLSETELLPSHRLMGWLVEQGRRNDAVALWERVVGRGGPLPVRPAADGLGLVLDTRGLLGSDVPDQVARLREHESGWEAVAEGVRRNWRGYVLHGTLSVRRVGVRQPFRLQIRSLDDARLSVQVHTPHGPVTLSGPVSLPPNPSESP
jgi:glycosyltransferase involved in cell wall biosynthesis